MAAPAMSSVSPRNQKTTASPFGEDSYECFVSKGSCRRCGCMAFGKRKCQWCERKYCTTCAPQSLQKYGKQTWEECCVTCERSLAVVDSIDHEIESFQELEPASKRVNLSDESQTSPDLRVLLDDRQLLRAPKVSIASSRVTTNTSVGTICNYKKDDPYDDDQKEERQHRLSVSPRRQTEDKNIDKRSRFPASVTNYWLSSSHASPQERQKNKDLSCPRNTNRATISLFAGLSLVPPTDAPLILTATDPGCCTACHQYATGKAPCETCGAKYCHDVNPNDIQKRRCLDLWLYKTSGTCAKCRGGEPVRPVQKEQEYECLKKERY